MRNLDEIDRPILSICIPTYNRAKYVDRCLREITKLKHKNIEIIISDNCSSDNTAELVQNYNINDKRVRYFCNDTNLGQTVNVTKCFELSRGRYIYITSDEDLINLDFFEKILDDLIKYSPSLVFGSIAFENNKNKFSDKEQDKIFSSIANIKLPERYAFRGYISGIIYKADCLNIEKLTCLAFDQSNLYGYMPAILMCISHGPIITKKLTICYRDLAETQFTDYELKGINLHYSQPKSRIMQLEYKIHLLRELISDPQFRKHLVRGLARQSIQIQRDLGFKTCSERERVSYRMHLRKHKLIGKYYYWDTIFAPKIIVKNIFYRYGLLK